MGLRKSFLHKVNYINWHMEATTVKLTIVEFDAKVSWYQEHGNLMKSKTKRLEWCADNPYRLDQNGYWRFLYVIEGESTYKKYVSHAYEDRYNLPPDNPEAKLANTGTLAHRIEDQIFKRLEGVTERQAFGYCDRENIQKCVPKQLYYIDSLSKNKVIHHVSKADFSSHYPDHQRGLMPTWTGHKEVEGTVEPTEEYPFAFYIKSGHSAEYEGYDTHLWLHSKLARFLFNDETNAIKGIDPHIDPAKDVTILCKASEYTFDKTVEELYASKAAGIDYKVNNSLKIGAKMVLNSAIGYKHLKYDYKTPKSQKINQKTGKLKRSFAKEEANRLDHIAAVVIARANQQMVDYFWNMGDKILQIVVDSIIYKGKNEIGVHEKKLGNLVQEVTDADFIMTGTNKYMMFKDNLCVSMAHSGCNTDLYDGKLEDIFRWRRLVKGKEVLE